MHAATDYGEYDSIMDEYLSNIYMTDRAFGELTEYLTEQYEKTGRKVIVAMAGDHAPALWIMWPTIPLPMRTICRFWSAARPT